MKPAGIPHDDAARVAALARYEILDTTAEPYFDAIAKLAATILGVPIALVSLVDVNRQWFKARYGLTATETPRDVSFCGHVVDADRLLVVPDAHADERFADNPLVTGDPNIRFYAGMPLRSEDGFVLGTLCAIDTVARELSADQLDSLRLLAGQVVALLELRRTGQRLREERRLLTEREVELEDRERRLESVFDGMVEGVVLQDQTGAILRHNRAAEDILGLSHDQLMGLTSFDPRWRATRGDGSPFPGEEHPAIVTLRTGQAQTDVAMRVHKADGVLRWLAINSRPLVRAGEPRPYAAITTFRDVTEQREISERLAAHQRLVTVGTLAAGVGHEINNPLAYALTNLDLAIEELEAIAGASPSQRLSEIIDLLVAGREGGHRVRRIVRGLKTLARDQTEVAPVDLGSVARTAIQMANHEIHTRCTVRVELAEGVLVCADESRLAQVLINLIVNAAQAFIGGDPSTNLVTVRTRRDGVAVIEVADNGPGITPEVLPRIFDPFFTTKAVGKGTGLGLAISHGIVTGLGGEIRCLTELGVGTTFRITLPQASPPAASVAEAPVPRRGRLLVIDDERPSLDTFVRMFRSDYDVVPVQDPREALRRLEAGEHFDLVFCDLSMPYLSGMELHDAIVTARPEVAARMVFISGDLGRDDIGRFLARVPNERLEKPVSLQDLRGIVRRYLGDPKPA